MFIESIRTSSNLFPIVDWGCIDYELANKRQQDLVQMTYQKQSAGQIIFCNHPPLVTVGRATKDSDVFAWKGQVLKTPRGGRATYHGPNQLVIYPIVNLNYTNYESFKNRDVTSYLRTLEKVVIETLSQFSISAHQRCEKIEVNGESLEATGVWVGEKKIASIGVAVRRWVSYHGIAINILNDESAFKGINPCGFSSSIMTSMELELGKTVCVTKLKSVFKNCFAKYFC